MNPETLRYWLIRLPMTFLVIGLFLGWEVYKSVSGRGPAQPPWRLGLYTVAMVLCFVLSGVGMRQRHRRGR